MKKFICTLLCMVLAVSVFTGCSQNSGGSTTTTTTISPMTLTLTAITDDTTTPEAIAQVQEFMNNISKSEFKTQVELRLMTADEYVNYIERTFAAANAQAEDTTASAEDTSAETVADTGNGVETEPLDNEGADDSAEVVTVELVTDEYGRLVEKYPDAEQNQLDIIFMTGRDMLKNFQSKGYLAALDEELSGDAKMINKYVYPTFIEAGKISGTQYAILNNRNLGNYKFLLIDKELADKYQFDTTSVKTLKDCEAFLDQVKEGESNVIPMNKEIDVANVQYVLGNESLLGCILGTSESTIPSLMYGQPAYVEHKVLLEKMVKGGYFADDPEKEGQRYAIEYVESYERAPEDNNWTDDHYVVVYEEPIASYEKLYSGMFGVSSTTKSVKRSMEIIRLLMTNAEYCNAYQYGISDTHYSLNDNGTIEILSDDYSMDLYHTGNVFLTYPTEDMPADIWEIYKEQNQNTVVGPYLLFPYDDQSYGEQSLSLVNRFITLSNQYMDQYQQTVMQSDALNAADYIAEAYARLIDTQLIIDNLSVLDVNLSGDPKTPGIVKLYMDYLTASLENS